MSDEPHERSAGSSGRRGRRRRDLAIARELTARAAQRARVKAIGLTALLVAVILAFESRYQLLGERANDPHSTLRVWDTLVRAPVVIATVVLGWVLARDVGQALSPALRRRMNPAGAGTVGFLIRLATVATTVVVAAGFAGVDLRALVVGGAFTAVVVGLAAQQTLGNLIAGTVLLTARPFRVGERVRLQGSPGRVEGLVTSLGLLYTTFADGEDEVMVPNSVVLASAVASVREPAAVSLRARIPADLSPADLEQIIESALTTPIRARPRVTLVELDGEDVVVEIAATPQTAADGAQLATELLEVVSRQAGAGGGEADHGGTSRGASDGGAGPGGPAREAGAQDAPESAGVATP